MSFVTPAPLAFAADGAPVSPEYGDIYHSSEGGPGQARHVFLGGNRLPERWQGRDSFVILETGFGAGLNFLTTGSAWLADPVRCCRLDYLAVEKHPFRREDLQQLHALWPEYRPLSEPLLHAWPVLTPGVHRLELADGRLVLTLMLGDAQHLLPRCKAQVDAFYLDGFDPKKNPEMWSPTLLRRLSRLAARDATLATWCVAGSVREALMQAGFELTKQPGFARKRHMLTGRLSSRAPDRPPVAITDRQALIIGAGLAGCALAERLAARGWRVTLLERHPAPAQEASGNLAGIVRPLLSRDDNPGARFSRACFLHALRAWRRLVQDGHAPRLGLDGVFQMARDEKQEGEMRELPVSRAYPEEYVHFLEKAQAFQQLGYTPDRGGWLFPGAGWANPPSLCRAWLKAGASGIELSTGRSVQVIERRHEIWHALDASGQPLAAAPVLILTAGAAAGELLPLPLQPVRGQVSHLPEGELPKLRIATCREGYLTPAVDGIHCLGASYAYDLGDELRDEEHAGNLRRLETLLPGMAARFDPARLGGRVGFRAATPDRLPLVGNLPDLEAVLPQEIQLRNMPRKQGLYGLLGLGSRGLVWAALAAEILASQLQGEPAPVESDLLDAIDPARFLLRAQRRGRR